MCSVAERRQPCGIPGAYVSLPCQRSKCFLRRECLLVRAPELTGPRGAALCRSKYEAARHPKLGARLLRCRALCGAGAVPQRTFMRRLSRVWWYKKTKGQKKRWQVGPSLEQEYLSELAPKVTGVKSLASGASPWAPPAASQLPARGGGGRISSAVSPRPFVGRKKNQRGSGTHPWRRRVLARIPRAPRTLAMAARLPAATVLYRQWLTGQCRMSPAPRTFLTALGWEWGARENVLPRTVLNN